MSHPAAKYAFGPFRVDVAENQLLRDSQPVPLTSRAFELLTVLLEQSGHLVDKQELLRRVWGGTFVEEAVLSVNVAAIRHALADNGHHYIETVPKHGYRFVAPVQRITPTDAPAEERIEAASVAAAAGVQQASTRARGVRLRWVAMGSLAVLLLGVQASRQALSRSALGRSVAVLPLQSLSADPEQQHFADAMTDLLITDLGEIPQLRVVSRQSVMQYKRTQKTVPQIARELNVDAIIEGTVRRDGDQVRITAQLIDAASDRHLWARSYERDLIGAFAFQDDVAESVAQEVGIKLSPTSPARVSPAVPAAAYEAYLRGMYLLDRGQSTEAIAEFRRAVAADPNYSAAYAKIASAYFDLAYFSTLPPDQAFPRMREAALQAIEADGSNASAHASLAIVKLHYDWDWPGADREFRRSLELNPSDSEVRHIYAHYLLTVGRWQDSLAEMDRAFQTDPVGLFTAT